MASSKLITYDLCKADKNYDGLYTYLKSFPKWAKITESTWFVSSEKTCVRIRDEILTIVDSNDRIFVAELTGTAAWHGVKCDSDYLKNNL